MGPADYIMILNPAKETIISDFGATPAYSFRVLIHPWYHVILTIKQPEKERKWWRHNLEGRSDLGSSLASAVTLGQWVNFCDLSFFCKLTVLSATLKLMLQSCKIMHEIAWHMINLSLLLFQIFSLSPDSLNLQDIKIETERFKWSAKYVILCPLKNRSQIRTKCPNILLDKKPVWVKWKGSQEKKKKKQWKRYQSKKPSDQEVCLTLSEKESERKLGGSVLHF